MMSVIHVNREAPLSKLLCGAHTGNSAAKQCDSLRHQCALPKWSRKTSEDIPKLTKPYA